MGEHSKRESSSILFYLFIDSINTWISCQNRRRDLIKNRALLQICFFFSHSPTLKGNFFACIIEWKWTMILRNILAFALLMCIIYTHSWKWREASDTTRTTAGFHITFIAFICSFFAMSRALMKNKLEKNVRDFYHAFGFFLSFYDDDDGVIYSLKRYVFITNFQGNFQHHPIFIICLFTLPLCAACAKSKQS